MSRVLVFQKTIWEACAAEDAGSLHRDLAPEKLHQHQSNH